MAQMNIFSEEAFESERLYGADSKMHAIVSAKLKEIFARLFRNTDINLDDFYFTCSDQKEPNAFMSDSIADKTVICVSYGLIMALTRTEEFAAIIAHECGHVIWKDLIGGYNTIIQERSADIHSVDMMINAGYNPRYVTVAQKKIFGKFSNTDVSFDVHGDSFHRIEDVKAYMTKIASERGDFPDITNDKPDAEWMAFQSEIEKIHQEETFDTFFDKELKKKFGEKDVLKINRLDVLKFFLECIKNHPEWFRAEHKARLKDFKSKLGLYNFKEKTPEEAAVLGEIFVSLYENVSFTRGEILRDLLMHFELGIFGPFKEQYENIENIIKYCYDKEKAIEYAKKIKALKWTADYIDCLRLDGGFPAFEPLGKDNVGKRLPWDQLASYKDKNIDDIYNLIGLDSYVRGNYSHIKKYEKDDYFIDENGIVIAYGEEAHVLNKNKNNERIIDNLKRTMKEIEGIVQLFELYVKFLKGEVSKQDYEKSFKEIVSVYKVPDLNGKAFSFNIYDLHGRVYVSERDREIIEKENLDYSIVRDVYNKIKSTSFYKEFIETSPEMALYPEHVYKESLLYLLQRIALVLNPANHSNFDKFLLEALLQNTNKVSKNNEQFAAEEYNKLMFVSGRTCRIDDDFILEKYRYEKNFLWEDRKKAEKNRDKYMVDFQNKVIKHAIKNTHFVFNMPNYLKRKIEEELSKEEPSELIATMMKTIGITKMPKNHQELDQALMLCQNNSQIYLDNHFIQLQYILLAEYLKNGYKCNIPDLLKYFLEDFRRIEKPFCNKEIQEIFVKNITVSDFSNLDLMDKIKLYEFMNIRGLFSEKTANKNTFIRIIVNEIIKSNQNSVIQTIVEPWLTRKPVTEYGRRSDKDIEFANEREKLIDFYALYWAGILGKDDGSEEYLQRVKTCTDFITQTETDSWGNKERLFSQMIAQNVLNIISDKVVAQERAAKMFADAGKYHVNADTVNGYDYYGRGAEAIFSILAKTPDKALKTIKFLNEKLTENSVDTFLSSVFSENELSSVSNTVNKESLTMIHENFWSASLPVRAYVMNRLLSAYTTKDKDKLDLVVNTYFNQDSEYYNDAVIVLESVYNNLQDYEKSLILSALLSSGQNDNGSNITNGQQVGRGLKMFFQAKGGAFVKFGQLLSYLPSLDSDIRKELATLREKANLPTRDELFEMLRTSLPESEFNKISYVGKILGGGSIYVSVHVKYDNQDTVIALMRPHTRDLMESGIDMISRTIDEMASKDKKFAVLKNIVTQAKLSCESEIDIQQDYQKYSRAVKIYETLKVHVGDAEYSPYVARWYGYGSDENKDNAYKIMEMAKGESLTSSDIEESEKHEMAIAYVALELAILLSGATWDTDRHMGQQNFYNNSFRDFCIGIFDTGAQMGQEPKRADKIMLGHLLYELIREARNGKDISSVLNSNVKFLDSMGKTFGVDTLYIDGVQRGLIALSDIMEYQKEIKDEDGNIIQERKVLTEKDLQNIIIAVMDSGVIDKTVIRTIRAKAVFNKLRILRPGWFRTLSEGFSNTPSNITVEYTGAEPEVPRLDILRKAKEEIAKLMALRESKKHLGIDKDLIINKPEDASGRD